MDIKAGLSIYNKPWLIEPDAALRLLDFWEKVISGETRWDYFKAMEDDETKSEMFLAAHMKFFSKEGVSVAPVNSYQLSKFKGFDGAGIAIIPVSGPLMKADFCGDFGTASLSQMTRLASNTNSVHTIIHVYDTPGGTVDGTENFSNTIKGSNKQTIGYTDGMSCSAGYWLMSANKEVVAGGQTDIIGSIGTMCSFYDRSRALENDGIILREYYATESVDKNKIYRDAMKGDGKALVKEMLDPLNNIFLQSVQDNRSGKLDLKKENVLTGKTYTSGDAVRYGLADRIAPLEQVIQEANTKASKNKNSKTYVMSGKNIVFQNVLNAVNAENFPVVDGGFLVTEEQLNEIDAALNPNNTMIASQAKRIMNLEEQLEAASNNAEALTAANTRATTAEGALVVANATIESLKNATTTLAREAGQFFTPTGSAAQQDKGSALEQEGDADLSKLSHNQKADEMFGTIKTTK